MDINCPDIDLWIAFKKADREAFAQLFKRYYSSLYQYGLKFSDPKTVEDCIQDLFIELWHNNSETQPKSVKAYLLSALKYKVYKSLRNHSPERSLDAFSETQGFDLSAENLLISREEEKQNTERMLEAVNRLPARQKEIIYLKIYQHLNYEEVSQVMEINYQVARNLFSQAIKSLRTILQKQ